MLVMLSMTKSPQNEIFNETFLLRNAYGTTAFTNMKVALE